mmetsp:Transcript_27793/g.45685  ORF Transcript_27793/g.45685 Transcript_27793/m.45685 type:complete len:650 (-) Transcript_27793:95-2044(-)
MAEGIHIGMDETVHMGQADRQQTQRVVQAPRVGGASLGHGPHSQRQRERQLEEAKLSIRTSERMIRESSTGPKLFRFFGGRTKVTGQKTDAAVQRKWQPQEESKWSIRSWEAATTKIHASFHESIREVEEAVISWWTRLIQIHHVMMDKSIPLLVGVVLALIWSNLGNDLYGTIFGSYYSDAHPIELLPHHGTVFGHHPTFLFLINDCFMVFFFGLATKEITDALLPGGSLNSIQKALCPLFATLGGILGPVFVFLAVLNIQWAAGAYEGDGHTKATLTNGWVVATPTDIPLAALLANQIFGKGHPAVNFLLLLAVADDALGLLIIAVFFPDPHHPVQPVWVLLIAGAALLAYFMRRVLKLHSWLPYVFVAGFVSWVGFIKTGIHPALALVPVVPFIPSQPTVTRGLMHQIKSFCRCNGDGTSGGKPHFDSALNKFEHQIHPFVGYGMFFFGIANAGVNLTNIGHMTGAVVVGLVLGKPLGILLATLAATKLGKLDHGLATKDLVMMSCLAGLALTVSLFMAGLAFSDHPQLQEQAKLGALLASLLVAAVCYGVSRVWDFDYRNATYENEIVKDQPVAHPSVTLPKLARSGTVPNDLSTIEEGRALGEDGADDSGASDPAAGEDPEDYILDAPPVSSPGGGAAAAAMAN